MRSLYREMYAEWPFAQSFFSLMSMVLAKADPRISGLYDEVLVPPELRSFGGLLRELLGETIERVLDVTGESALLEKDKAMARTVENRKPWLAPLNVAQVNWISLAWNLLSSDAAFFFRVARLNKL